MPIAHFPPYPRRPHSTGQARVCVDGKRIYLGKHQSHESIARYDALRDDWLRRKTLDRSTLTVDELALRYLEHAISYYAKEGAPTSEVACIRSALRPLVMLFGPTLAAAFGPLSLEAVRQEMIRLGRKRKSINRQVQRICRAFRWAVSREILPESVYVKLETLEPLTAGRSAAIEGRPVQAVPLPLVDAIRPHVSRQVWGLIQLQLLTGARPGELVAMRVGDLNTSGKIWEYVPRRHKTQHRGKHRVISIGPRGQALLKEFLTANLDSFVFSPVDAEAERNAARRERRQSPLTPSQAARQASPDGRRRPRAHYTVASYRRAIQRGCEIAFEMPAELRKMPATLAPPERSRLRSQAAEWRESYCWQPNQLRHSAATFLRREFGAEAARVILGHAHLATTEIYAERDLERAREIMGTVG